MCGVEKDILKLSYLSVIKIASVWDLNVCQNVNDLASMELRNFNLDFSLSPAHAIKRL